MSATRSDSIFLRGLAVPCIIGFIDWERRVKQTVVIDLELPVDCARTALTDEVADTLDYKRLAKLVIAFVEGSHFKLVETLAHRTALLILEEFGVAWVRLTLNKPGAIRGSRDVGVTIERTQADALAARTAAATSAGVAAGAAGGVAPGASPSASPSATGSA